MDSDFQKMTRLYDELGIKYVVNDAPEDVDGKKVSQSIRIGEGAGYYDFYAEFFFLDGKFITHGVWE